MLENHQVSPHVQLGTVLWKRYFQEYHHHQLMQELNLSPVNHGHAINIVNRVPLQQNNSFTQQEVTVFTSS